MLWTSLHIIDIFLWAMVGASVAYIFFFAIISLFYEKDDFVSESAQRLARDKKRFLVLFPAYHEDSVILNSVVDFLEQDYPKDRYLVVVISDHMTEETNNKLKSFPIKLLTPVFEKSSKAKAMQYAIENVGNDFDAVVVMDADNVVQPSFLDRLNILLHMYDAIQCHRCAKNSNNDVAALDGVSEEINNTIFRKAHNRIGLSSALIGSGMCFTYPLFVHNVFKLSTAGEDRELEALLLNQEVFIKYAADVPVFDEKVSTHDNFQRQRMRWMTAQIQSLFRQLPQIPRAALHGNINFIDKTIQQALIPRSILIVLLTGMSVLMTILVPTWSAKWWILLAILAVSLLIAIPGKLRSRALFGKAVVLPSLVLRMLKNLLHIDRRNTDFIHTEHSEN